MFTCKKDDEKTSLEYMTERLMETMRSEKNAWELAYIVRRIAQDIVSRYGNEASIEFDRMTEEQFQKLKN